MLGQCFTDFNMYTNHLRSCLATNSVVLEFCVFNKFQKDANAAGPQAIFGVARS